MIRKVTKQSSRDEVLALLQPLVRDWFASKFPTLTEPQAFAVPLIHERKSVLISSPTGSGKTLTAFLSVINELYSMQLRGELEDKIYAVYVSPLKALANDINRNLEQPLQAMRTLAEEKGLPIPEIRVGVRSGDTTSQERQKQARNPPHIFITTPESLSLVLSAPKFRERFSDTKWIVVDEIHEICGNKRGALLSLSLERLQDHVGADVTRVGLSATIAPIDEIAHYLAGYSDGRLREVHVVEVESRKSLDIAVLCPVRDLSEYAMQEANAKMYDLLTELISKHHTTLVFTNTRSGTEHVSFKLKEQGVEDLEAHHGSLSKETRLDVEEKLKRGALKAVVTSTSLELGIDIGYIDLVCQIGSPKSIAKALQRIGRAGHNYGDTSVGRMIVFEPWDLMECATLVKAAYENRIDRVDIVRNSLDVLAQAIIGMSLEKRWDAEDAFEIIRRAHSYHDLPKKDFLKVLEYLSSRNPDVKVFAKIWFDADEKRFGKKRGTRLIYYTNVGTIPEEGSYHVISERGTPLGELSEKFVEYLKPSDVFVLGGRTHQFLRVRGMTVYVKDASGRRPTVPSWTGEMLPRSFDLSTAVGEFRRLLAGKIDELGDPGAMAWLLENFRLDEGSARSLVSHVQEQRAVLPELPSDQRVVVEGYMDEKGTRNVIFHYCFGRRTNDALSRAYAHALTEKYKTNVRVSVTDDCFMLTVPKRIELEGIEKLVTSETLEDQLRRAVRTTEMFKQRFRHCATRAFMILRNYKGREVSIGRQQLRSQRVLDWLHEIEDFPVVKETYHEILNEVMDLRHAREVLEGIESGKIEVKIAGFSNLPSPFAHSVVLAGVSDLVLMEDRSALLRELHKQILRRIVPEKELEAAQFKEDEVKGYFRAKLPVVERKDDIPALLERVGALNLLQEKAPSVFEYSKRPAAELRAWGGELMEAGKAQSVWTPRGIVWAPTEEVPVYAALYAQKSRLKPDEEAVAKALEAGPASLKSIAKSVKRESKTTSEVLRKLERAYVVHRRGVEETVFALRPVKRESFEAALDRLLTRHLDVHGPTTAHELAYVLDLEEDLVKEALRDLEQEGTVASGHFVVAAEYQYMLSRDHQRLRRRGDTREAFEETRVKGLLLQKQFHGLRTIDDYFDRFLEAGMAFDVFNHVESFDSAEWLRRREAGEILEGRFLNGRVRYVRAKDVPLFLSAFPRDELNELETQVLEVVKAHPEGIDVHGIQTGVPQPWEKVREALETLDYDCYVIRKFQGDGWTTRNLYVPFEMRDDLVEDAEEKVILACLRAYGPAPLSSVKEYTRFHWDEVQARMDALEEAGKVVRILVSGKGEGEMYVLAEELPALREAVASGATDRARVLSILDPWTQPLWAQYSARWGEGWYFPIVKDGDLVGMAEIWEMSGCVEIREIDLNSPELLPEVLAAVDRMME
ncbi:MAG TPA: ATP-dependent helicase, partial [Thermoplasmata archaeon]|nr:ATP-dependent helicase [Thermoplasmata archaeon]